MASAPRAFFRVNPTATAAGGVSSNALDNVDVGLQRTEGRSDASQHDPTDDASTQLRLDEDSDDSVTNTRETRMNLCFKMLLLRKVDRKMPLPASPRRGLR
eukprot:jgi/Undpi1/8701/HiC_scaffold_25.g11166.m1